MERVPSRSRCSPFGHNTNHSEIAVGLRRYHPPCENCRASITLSRAGHHSLNLHGSVEPVGGASASLRCGKKKSSLFRQSNNIIMISKWVILTLCLMLWTRHCSAQSSITFTSPAANATYAGTQGFNGQFILTCPNCSLTRLAVAIDGTSYGNASVNSGRWYSSINTSALPEGGHTMVLTAFLSNGANNTASTTFKTASTGIGIDTPASNGSYLGQVTFSGWALDPSAAVSAVNLAIDGTNIGSATFCRRGRNCYRNKVTGQHTGNISFHKLPSASGCE